LKILIATWTMKPLDGGTLFVAELAASLAARGHDVAIYARNRGMPPAGSRFRDRTIIHDLRDVPFEPEVIHCHSQPVMLEAIGFFPRAPVVYAVHHATDGLQEPLFHPQVHAYVGVDERCRRRIAANPQIPPERIGMILNFVDLDMFRPRSPLPTRPSRALIFSNFAHRTTHLTPILQACAERHLDVDTIGRGVGKVDLEPAFRLPRYDLVFAKARCAIEALAVGNAVVLCDFSGLGGMVSGENLERFRQWNFGGGVLTRPLDAALIGAEIDKYDAQDAAAVCARLRAVAGLDKATDEWLRLYQDAAAHTSWPQAAMASPQASRAALRWRIVDRLWLLRHLVLWVEVIPGVGKPLAQKARDLWQRVLRRTSAERLR